MTAKSQEGNSLHAKVFGLPPGALDHPGLETKVVVSEPSALHNGDFETLDKPWKEDDSESDSDGSEPLLKRLEEIKGDCDEHEIMLLGGVVMPGKEPPRRGLNYLRFQITFMPHSLTSELPLPPFKLLEILSHCRSDNLTPTLMESLPKTESEA
jgi:hypothetical protein